MVEDDTSPCAYTVAANWHPSSPHFAMRGEHQLSIRFRSCAHRVTQWAHSFPTNLCTVWSMNDDVTKRLQARSPCQVPLWSVQDSRSTDILVIAVSPLFALCSESSTTPKMDRVAAANKSPKPMALTNVSHSTRLEWVHSLLSVTLVRQITPLRSRCSTVRSPWPQVACAVAPVFEGLVSSPAIAVAEKKRALVVVSDCMTIFRAGKKTFANLAIDMPGLLENGQLLSHYSDIRYDVVWGSTLHALWTKQPSSSRI